MPYSYATTVASGASALVSVPFSYIDKAHVHVTLNGVAADDGTLTWISAGQLQLSSTPVAGTKVKVYRTTPILNPEVVFASGDLDPADLNANVLQALYVDQEAVDAALAALNLTTDALKFDARALEVTNAADGTTGSSLATVQQVAVAIALGAVGPAGAVTKRQVVLALVDATNPSGANVYPVVMAAVDPLCGDAGSAEWFANSPMAVSDALYTLIATATGWNGTQMTSFLTLARSKPV